MEDSKAAIFHSQSSILDHLLFVVFVWLSGGLLSRALKVAQAEIADQ
jgi:hypothetical protein